MRYKSSILILLLVISGGIALWFLGSAAWDLWTYTRAGSKAEAHIEKWDVEEMGSSAFAISASYYFEAKGKKFQGKTLFKEPRYLNRLSAEGDLKKWEAQRWEAWYDPASPGFSTLQKLFPYKRIWHALLTLGVFLYFLIGSMSLSRK